MGKKESESRGVKQTNLSNVEYVRQDKVNKILIGVAIFSFIAGWVIHSEIGVYKCSVVFHDFANNKYKATVDLSKFNDSLHEIDNITHQSLKTSDEIKEDLINTGFVEVVNSS